MKKRRTIKSPAFKKMWKAGGQVALLIPVRRTV
jgi:hypothetical protein